MRSNVTAIIVAKREGERLSATLQALANQSVTPDRTIAVVTGDESLATHLGTQGLDQVLKVNPKHSFGEAVAAATLTISHPEGNQPEWLWLLTEDTAPDPDALQRMLTKVAATGTAVVAGPKLVDWDRPERIIEVSEGLTWAGSRWVLDRQELDQQQYDHYEDVLGVAPAGMLVRRDVWDKLEGFDPALPVYDTGLDFSIRARLAGYRVIVVPEARVRYARDGIAGPKINHRGRVLRRAHRQARTAQLHRRITYAPAILAPLIWLTLPIIGVLGLIWAVIRERPGTMLGELGAALTVFVHPGRILASRRTIRRTSTVGWKGVRPLRTDRKTVRSVNIVRKEAILASQGKSREDLHFVGTGGLALTSVMTLVGIALTWWLIGTDFVTGGAAGHLSRSLGTLWGNTVSQAAVNVGDLASFIHTVPADPFTWVLALLGTLTFWNPSLSVVLLFIVATPVAALGGWMWASRLTPSASGRMFLGTAWGIAPVLLAALVTGRPATIVLMMALPWLFYSLSKTPGSWSWAGTSSFLAAIVLASAPVLIPAAVVLLIVGVLSHTRQLTYLASVAIVPLALFAPKILNAIASGRRAEFFADPTFPHASTPATTTEMLTGYPIAGHGGWDDLLTSLGLTDSVQAPMLTLILVAPIVLLALIGVFFGAPRHTILLTITTALGAATAVLSPHLTLTPQAETLVPVFAGSGVALMWLGLVSLATLGLATLLSAEMTLAIITGVAVLGLSLPAMVQATTMNTDLTPQRETLPAVVIAETRINEHTQTLLLTPQGETELRAKLVSGSRLTLDSVRTATLTEPVLESETVLADLVGELASTGAPELAENLNLARIGFIVLTPARDASATTLRSQLQETFDQHSTLTAVGDTSHGLLWRVNEPAPVTASDSDEAEAAENAETPRAEALGEEESDPVTTSTRPVSGTVLWTVQLVVLALMFLLALPTGEVREKPLKRRSPRTWRRRTDTTAVTGSTVSPGSTVVSDTDTDTGEETAPEVATAGDDAASQPAGAADSTETLETAVEAAEEPGDVDEVAGEPVGDHTDEVPIVKPVNELPDDDTIYVGNDPRRDRGTEIDIDSDTDEKGD